MSEQVLSSISLSELVGSLVRDVVDADGMAAKATAEFLENVCFDKGELRMLRFSYEQPAPGGGTKKYTVSVPLLTVIPIPMLGVEAAEISFTATIVEMEKDEADTPRLQAKIAPNTALSEVSGSEQANVKFTLKMGRSDMTAGLSGIFGLLGNKIQVAQQ
ncbi:DUF2589 domain-containing protein [Polyangium sp. 6x1]|uniref:DUF2589 domain-containing protein n=1 Tax=Polyangium sp. 6x1 TaxID=3042689 RepID=UPI00248322FF|nr:DUF2589 domain-containing protein [Polyangium sp. 6x1]MDI1443845.1 DUF2589 domain-containing protein [Polyangium sp. 6x1]